VCQTRPGFAGNLLIGGWNRKTWKMLRPAFGQ
jgi:hypothetical protein